MPRGLFRHPWPGRRWKGVRGDRIVGLRQRTSRRHASSGTRTASTRWKGTSSLWHRPRGVFLRESRPLFLSGLVCLLWMRMLVKCPDRTKYVRESAGILETQKTIASSSEISNMNMAGYRRSGPPFRMQLLSGLSLVFNHSSSGCKTGLSPFASCPDGIVSGSRFLPATSSAMSRATFIPISALVSMVDMKLSIPEV